MIGDVGHHKEFIIGDGITEAFIQAKTLAQAIMKESQEALKQWWRARDVEALPLFFFAQDERSAILPLEIQRLVFSRVAKIPELRERLGQVFDHTVSQYDAFPVPKIFGWTLGAVLKGNLHLLLVTITTCLKSRKRCPKLFAL